VGTHEDGGMMGVLRVEDRPVRTAAAPASAAPLVCDLPTET
jgi:hypothetical protein